MSLLRSACFVTVLTLVCSAAHALTGEVTRVSDGDTIWVRADGQRPVKVRLQGIDAPELCQAWGERSRDALAARVMHRQVQVTVRGRDDYRRALGDLHLQGEDVQRWMVEQGHAWSYRHSRRGGPYADEERQARSARRGLFADASALEPRSFRRSHGPCATHGESGAPGPR